MRCCSEVKHHRPALPGVCRIACVNRFFFPKTEISVVIVFSFPLSIMGVSWNGTNPSYKQCNIKENHHFRSKMVQQLYGEDIWHLNIFKPSVIQFLVHLTSFLISILVKFYCFTSLWGWLYVFSLFPPCPPPQQPLPLTSQPFELNLRYLGQRIYRSVEIYWMTFPWTLPRVTAVASISKK